ncbi:MAG: hypothetical protein NTV29_11790 [Planctomycetota bacterium]|nr:hypothetical protein [Planctomycetota bacterium]
MTFTNSTHEQTTAQQTTAQQTTQADELPRFDPNGAKPLADWAHTSQLLCCRVDPTGTYVVAGGIDHTLQRWEIATGVKSTLIGHANWIRSLDFSPDGKRLYSGSYDGRWITWDIASAKPEPLRIVDAHRGWLRSLDVSPDGQRIVTCGNDRLVKLWSTDDGQQIGQWSGHPNIPYCVLFVPQTDKTLSGDVVSGDVVGNVYHWPGEQANSQVANPSRKFDASELFFHIGDIAPFGGIVNMAFSPDGKKLTVTGLHQCTNAPAGNRRAVALSFDWQTGEKLPKQECLTKEIDATMWRAIYHPSGTIIGILEKQIAFWHSGSPDAFHLAATPSEIFDCDLHPNQIDLYTAHFDGHVRSTRLGSL